ncbi:MAG TPA: cytochrome c oxidase subunit I [Thermomicrobiales bacterium]|nr:cytochrome c oxidase subunit I [Thermomicrobiales bacterium]
MATRVEVAPGRTTVVDRPAIAEPSGLWSWITTVDHKRIGIFYFALGAFYFLVGGIEAMMIRVQLASPNNDFVAADTYNQIFTMHGTTMIFLALMPLSSGFFNFLVPLMIGARDVAFPRLNALSWWILLFGSLLLNTGWLIGQAPNAGWFSYANLTSSAYSPGHNVDFWVLGIQVLGISSVISAINFLVTIINFRAPGMSMMRLPVFVWMTAVTAALIILAFPALTIGITLLTMDRFYSTNFFVPEAGGSPLLWQHLFWVFGHPEVYILILPAFGIVSEILPTFSRKPLFGYSAVVFSGIAIGFLGFGVWAHHMFTVGMGPLPTAVFSITTMLIALPTGVKIFNWIGTMFGGHLNFKTPLYFVLGFISMFIIGGLSGVMHASPPVDSQHQDSYFVVAHFHYVLFGGSLFGLVAGAYYWFPKLAGKMLSETLGKIHFWLMFIGFNLTFFPMHWVGLQGMPRRIYTYDDGYGWAIWNQIETFGALLTALSFIVFLINILISLTTGDDAPDDPWDAPTLEWGIPSPPPVYNFATIPTVTSRIPLWSQKYPEIYGNDDHGLPEHVHMMDADAESEAHEQAAPLAQPDVHAHDAHDGHDSIHLPNPSYWPLVCGLGITLALGGFLGTTVSLRNFIEDDMGINLWVFGVIPENLMTFVGLVMLVVSVYAWALEPAVGPGEVHDDDPSYLAAGAVGD